MPQRKFLTLPRHLTLQLCHMCPPYCDPSGILDAVILILALVCISVQENVDIIRRQSCGLRKVFPHFLRLQKLKNFGIWLIPKRHRRVSPVTQPLS